MRTCISSGTRAVCRASRAGFATALWIRFRRSTQAARFDSLRRLRIIGASHVLCSPGNEAPLHRIYHIARAGRRIRCIKSHTNVRSASATAKGKPGEAIIAFPDRRRWQDCRVHGARRRMMMGPPASFRAMFRSLGIDRGLQRHHRIK